MEPLNIRLYMPERTVWNSDEDPHCMLMPVCPNTGPKVIKTFFMLNSAVLKFFMLINLKLLIIANSFLLNIAEHDNFSAYKYENANYFWHFHIY